MTGIQAITLIVADPSAVAARLAAVCGWPVTQDYGAFAEVTTDGMLVWLNVPSEPTTKVQRGVLLHLEVPDVAAAIERARAAGARILREPTVMDYGMESGWAEIEGGPIVDFTRPL